MRSSFSKTLTPIVALGVLGVAIYQMIDALTDRDSHSKDEILSAQNACIDFNLRETRPVAVYHFDDVSSEQLTQLQFIRTGDDLDNVDLAHVRIDGVMFMVRRYDGNPVGDYTVEVDMVSYLLRFGSDAYQFSRLHQQLLSFLDWTVPSTWDQTDVLPAAYTAMESFLIDMIAKSRQTTPFEQMYPAPGTVYARPTGQSKPQESIFTVLHPSPNVKPFDFSISALDANTPNAKLPPKESKTTGTKTRKTTKVVKSTKAKKTLAATKTPKKSKTISSD